MNRSEAAATITPVTDADRCSEDGCETSELLSRVDPDATNAPARVLCPTHRVAYLREVSDA